MRIDVNLVCLSSEKIIGKTSKSFWDGSRWEIIIIKLIHTFTSIILFEQRCWSGLPQSPFDLKKTGATQTETSLLKQYGAGERVDLLDNEQEVFLAEGDVYTVPLTTQCLIVDVVSYGTVP